MAPFANAKAELVRPALQGPDIAATGPTEGDNRIGDTLTLPAVAQEQFKAFLDGRVLPEDGWHYVRPRAVRACSSV